YFTYEQRKYIQVSSPDLSKLNGLELALIDDVLNRLSDKSAAELSEYSHRDTPWSTSDDGQEIPYESVFYRDSDHTVREYADKL
ncbi:MAG: type II toxin-antitoxin system antitoxin SocA domain-containing protein, partial [Patescibacteria group bacterium]